MAEDFHVTALKRQRAHLKDVGADPGELAENGEFLRLAGVDVAKLDEPDKEEKAEVKPVKAERAKTPTPKGRTTAPKAKAAEGVTSDFLSGRPKATATSSNKDNE